jgi:hypothetical protein
MGAVALGRVEDEAIEEIELRRIVIRMSTK